MKNLVLTFASFLFFIGIANAQDGTTASHTIGIDIKSIALVDIEATDGTKNITLSPVVPTEAGNALDFTNATNSNLWLNYSSIVSASTKSRTITASISSGLPGGTTITVAAAAPTGGKGNRGTANTTPQTLSTGGVTVVSGIGSCYTGDGASNGSNLTYKLNMDDNSYGSLYQNNSYSVTVTYTITEEL